MTGHFQYTDVKCEECGGQVVMDIWRKDYYCLECGLVHGYYIEGATPINTDQSYSPNWVMRDNDEWREENEFTKK